MQPWMGYPKGGWQRMTPQSRLPMVRCSSLLRVVPGFLAVRERLCVLDASTQGFREHIAASCILEKELGSIPDIHISGAKIDVI